MREFVPSPKEVFLVEDQSGENIHVLNGFTRIEIVQEQIPETWSRAEDTEDLQEPENGVEMPEGNYVLYSLRVHFMDGVILILGYYETSADAKACRDAMLQTFLNGEPFYSLVPIEEDKMIEPMERTETE